MKKLHIVGGGAIGSLVAAGAQKNGIGNACYPRNIVAMPTEALWQDGGSTMLQPPLNTPTVLDNSDVLVFPLKVYQLQQAITQWLPYLENTPTIVLLHNGMGGLETARSLLPDDYPILLATTSHGALKETTSSGKIQVRHTGLGATQIGLAKATHRLPATLSALTQTYPLQANAIALLERALPPVHYQANILTSLWTKLSINAVINPLTALNNMQNKRIAEAAFAETRHAICHEFTSVANAYGYDFNEDDVHEKVLAVAKATGENYSSMHQDVLYGRQTEIDAINGYIVEMAKKKGIPVPENTLLVERVKALRL